MVKRSICRFYFLCCFFLGNTLYPTDYGDYTAPALQGSITINASESSLLFGFYVFSNVTFTDSTSTVTWASYFPTIGTITLNNGLIYLEEDFILSTAAQLLNGGIINGNGHLVYLPNTIESFDLIGTFSFIDVSLIVHSPLTLDGQFVFSGDCIVEGLHNVITCTSSIIIIDTDTKLLLRNCTLKGISAGSIYCLDSTSTLVLENVTLIQDGDYTFADGHLEIMGKTQVKGNSIFTYQSDQVSTIHENSTLFFDSGMTFSYGATYARNLISFIDSTSILHFYETSIYSVVPDLQLTKGTIIVEGECPADSAAMTGAWSSPPTDLSEAGEDAYYPQVAMDPAGNAMAVWQRSDGINTIIQASYYDGTWSTPTDLSEAGEDADGPQVAMDPSGNAMAVWRRYDGSHNIIQASYYDGTWSTPTDLSEAGQDADVPQVAMGPAGNAMAVWQRFDGSNTIIQASYYDGTWSITTDLSEAGQDADGPQVAMDPAGNAMAVWYRYDGSNTIIQASYYDGTWSTTTDLSEAGKTADSPQVAMDPAGNAMVVWRRWGWIQASYYDGTWSTTTDLSEAGEDAKAPQVAMDSADNTMAVWYRWNGVNYTIQASYYDGTWSSPPTDLSEAGQTADSPQVSMDPAGNAMAVWHRWNGSNWIVQASYYNVSTGAWFSSPTDLSEAGKHANAPQVAMDSIGNAMAVWYRWNGSNWIVQASYYNAATILDDGICLGDENNSVNLKILPESGFNIRSGYLVYKNV